MRKFGLVLAMAVVAVANVWAEDYTQYVDPFIGTKTNNGALSGGTFPGATMPFGFVQLSPETENFVTEDPCCGYEYNCDSIFGFTHTHLSGTGCTDLIDVSLMPTTKPISQKRLAKGMFGLPFSHEQEGATAGYYWVMLQQENIKAELSATVHTGIHRYTFPKGAEQHIVLDLARMMKPSEHARIIMGQMRVVNENTIEGYRIITGWAKLRKVYYRAEFSKPFKSYFLMDGNRNVGGSDVVNGKTLRAALEFDAQTGEAVTVKVALSPVDYEGARKNMAFEAKVFDFDAYKTRAHNIWNSFLSNIEIEATTTQKRIFYTGMYHLMMQPNTMSDVDGRYMNTNFEIKRMPKGEVYHSTFSLWDTFRAAHPLYALLVPSVGAQFVKDMVIHHESYGYLPIWDLWGQDNYCMIGNHSIPVLSYAILADMPGVDAERAYKAMFESSTRSHSRSPFEAWEKYGYMPYDMQGRAVSMTLEQAFDDWCVAAVAKKLGKMDDYERFQKRSEFYRNLFDGETGFFRAKKTDGKWVEPFDPLSYKEAGFVEGNAWQYLWFVPQNPQGLIELLGGEKAFIKKLNENFTLTATSGEKDGNASGFIGQYAHGNEPSHHTVYFYNFVGQPWRTQELVHEVRETLYNDTPCGYSGNDDCGQMSAWYIFSALGFYPFNAGNGEYTIGTPLFTKAVMHMPGGKDFTITAPRKNDKAIYVKGVKLNGQKITDWKLTHQQIMNGGSLEFVMKDKK